MEKIIKSFKVKYINVYIYRMDRITETNVLSLNYQIDKTRIHKKWRYSIKELGSIIHVSYLYDSIFLLKLLNKKGPVIGDCFTKKQYRGQSIYPYVINSIALESIKKGGKEVFIVVNQDNLSSIKGIEKAGFNKFVTINATRWLWFYLKKRIKYSDLK